MSLSVYMPLPPRSPCTPGVDPLTGSPTLSPSLSTLLPQHRSPHHRCSTTLGEPTPTSVYLPQSDQPFPSHPLSFAGSVPILHRRSLKVHVSYPQGGGSQTGVMCCLTTVSLARCFPSTGLLPVPASLSETAARQPTPED